jgi:hypothetical protein
MDEEGPHGEHILHEEGLFEAPGDDVVPRHVVVDNIVAGA